MSYGMMMAVQMNFYSDAYRVAMNIGLDAAWCGKTPELTQIADNMQRFFSEKTEYLKYDSYLPDGTPVAPEAMHPHAIVATLASASLAAEGTYRLEWVQRLWDLPLRKGARRYYDNCLHFFCLLMLSGRYRIFE
ncbi:MAG: hypothetical protein PUD16_06635 [bacterium]|nr:hypothetical protein [bacterium]